MASLSEKAPPAPSANMTARPKNTIRSLADTLAGQREDSRAKVDQKTTTSGPSDDIERDDVEGAMSSKPLYLALKNFEMIKGRLRNTESALSLAKEEVKAQTLRANSREKEGNVLKAKLDDMEEEFGLLSNSVVASNANRERMNQEIAQLRADMAAANADLERKNRKITQLRVDMAAAKNKAREDVEEQYRREMPALINKEVFKAHCRSLTLLGVAHGDPLWMDCQFPYKGARPAELEVMRASSACTTPAGASGNQMRDKQKIKIKEILGNCVEEKSLEFCGVLVIPIAKANRKEDIVEELVNFLMAPEATSTKLFVEKKQTSKGMKSKIDDRDTTPKQPSSKGKSDRVVPEERKVMKGKNKIKEENLEPSDELNNGESTDSNDDDEESEGDENEGATSRHDTKENKLLVKNTWRKPTKKAKNPNKPKRPASPFFVFKEGFMKTYKEMHPEGKSVSAVAKAAGFKWKSMSEAEKALYSKGRQEEDRVQQKHACLQ